MDRIPSGQNPVEPIDKHKLPNKYKKRTYSSYELYEADIDKYQKKGLKRDTAAGVLTTVAEKDIESVVNHLINRNRELKTVRRVFQENEEYDDITIGELSNYLKEAKAIQKIYQASQQNKTLEESLKYVKHPVNFSITENKSREAIDDLEFYGEKMSIEELKSNFDVIKNWHENNDLLLRKYLTNNEIDEINTTFSHVKRLLDMDNLSNSDTSDITEYILKYANMIEGPIYLADIWKVGKDKPVGEITKSAIDNLSSIKKTLEELANDAEKSGLRVYIDPGDLKSGMSPYLCVYDYEALDKLLQKNAIILENSGWTTDPGDFIDRTHKGIWVPPKTKLYDVIADAYADYTNPRRTDAVADESDSEDTLS